MAQRPINISVNYTVAVRDALQGGDKILKQMKEMEKLQFEQLQQLVNITDQMSKLGKVTEKTFDTAVKGTKRWSTELTRVGVFVNKTLASISGSVQSFGSTIRGALGIGASGIGSLTSGAASFISDFGKSVSDFIGTGGFVQQLGKAVASGARAFVGIGGKIGELIVQGIGTALSTIPKLLGELTKISGALSGLFGGVATGVLGGPGLLVGLLVSGVTNAAGAIQKAFGDVLGGLGDIATKAFGGIAQIAAEAVGAAIEVVSSIADRLADTLGQVGEFVGKAFGGAIAAGVAIALPLGFKAASFREGLSAAYGVVVGEISREAFDELVRGAKEVAIEVGVSLSEVPQALFKTISPGFTSINQSLADMAAAAKLAAIGNVELFTAVDTTNVILDSYGRAIEDVESIAVKLFNSTRLGRLEIEELTNTIGLVAGVASNAGIPLNDLLTTINLAQRSLPASRAITGLANAIGKLQRPTAKAREEFSEFFDSIQDGAGGITSFRKVFETLDELGIFRDPDKLRKIFPDERGIRAITAAMSQFVGEMELYDQVINTIADGNKAFEETADFALNTVSRAFTRLSSRIVSVADAVLEKLRPAIVRGVGALGDVLAVLQTRIEGIDPAAITDFTEGVVKFVQLLPSKLTRVADFFIDIKDSIVDATFAIKAFLDENLNLSRSFEQLIAGDIGKAIDLLFGSKAIIKARSFFQTIKIEFQSIFSRVFGLVSDVGGLLGDFGKRTIDNNLLLSAGRALSPNLSNLSPAEAILQTGLGVNTIQGAGNVVSGIAKGAAVGGGAGAAVGAGLGLLGGPLAPLTVPTGALLGGLFGGAAGAGAGGGLATKEDNATRSAIREFLELIERREKEIAKLTLERQDIAEGLNERYQAYADVINELNQISADIATIERDRAAKVRDLEIIHTQTLERRNELDLEIEQIESDTKVDIEKSAAVIAERLATSEILKREELRSAEIAKRERVIRERINAQLTQVELEVAEKLLAVRTLASPARSTFRRGVPFDAPGGGLIPGTAGLSGEFPGGVPLGAGVGSRSLFGTGRFSDLSGGEAEGILVTTLRELIDALRDNTAAEKAVKEALRPFNLDENLRGLNTRARVSIRRSKRDRQQALADRINSQFESTGIGDPFGGATVGDGSLFGFGSRGPAGAFGPSLRGAAFGGGLGFGTSLPGEDRRVDDQFARSLARAMAEFFGLSGFGGAFREERAVPGGRGAGPDRNAFLDALLGGLRGDSLGLLSPLGAAGSLGGREGEPFIDVGESFLGAASGRSRIRGGRRGRSPFAGSGEGVIESLKRLILELADTAFAGPDRGTKGKDLIFKLTEQAAEELGLEGEALRTAEGQTVILERVASLLEQTIAEDKAAAARAESDKGISKAKDELATARDKKAELEDRKKGAKARAEEGVGVVPAEEIRKKFLEAEEARIAKLLEGRAKLDEELTKLEEEIAKVNQEAQAKFDELAGKFEEVLKNGQVEMGKFSESVIDALGRQLDIGQDFAKILEKLNESMIGITKAFTEQKADVKRLRDMVERGR